jgi:hypothetical protein
MTPDEARGHIGHAVVYKPNQDEGVITSVNDHWVFVRYGSNKTSQATDPCLLALVRRRPPGDDVKSLSEL